MTRTARRQKLFALFALMLTSLTFFAAATSAEAKERIRPSGPVLPLPPTDVF